MAGPFEANTAYGTLVINGLSLHTRAWCAIDIRALFIPQDYRITNVVIPGAAGQTAQPYRIDGTKHSIPMYLTGDVNYAGSLNADRTVGWYENMGTLRGSLLTPPTPPTSFYAGTITLPGTLGTIRADVQVDGLEFVDHQQSVDTALLHLTVPAGRFV